MLREIIGSHPCLKHVNPLEPHDLWAAMELTRFNRYQNLPWALETIERARSWDGAKFALNPGTKALEWVHLKRIFPSAKFIFIARDREAVWQSFYKQDKNSLRGIVSETEHAMSHERLNKAFKAQADRGGGVYLEYEAILKNPDEQIERVWNYLGLPAISIAHMVRKPND